MDNYTMLLPNYTIGAKCYDEICRFCAPYGKKAVIIGGHKALAAVEKKIREAVEGSSVEIIGTLWYGGESSYENVDKLIKSAEVEEADMIFAVGGGKALDTCKCIGDKISKPVFTFPTIASNCSCCTSVSIMYSEDGGFLHPYFFLQPPVHAFINTQIMCEAPYKYLWAGMGDTYAKYYEATMSARGDELEHYTEMGVTISKMCAGPVLRYGAKALEDNKNKICSEEFKEVALAVTAVTALASIYLTRDHTPDYNSGMAHAVFYTLTAVKNIEENHLHGEVVAFGVLICLLIDGQNDEFEKIYKFNKNVGLPTSLDDIEISEEQIEALIPKMPDMSDIRHNPYKITEEMIREAFERLRIYNMKGCF